MGSGFWVERIELIKSSLTVHPDNLIFRDHRTIV